MTATNLIPSAKALQAFGVNTEPVLLSGGQGTSYRAGNIILKPADSAEETSWIAEVYKELKQDGFRIAHYLESTTGEWVVDGWFAQEFLAGKHSNARWKEAIETCKIFHRALLEIPRPAFLDAKTDPWSVADRVAWQEQPLMCYPELKQALDELFSVIRPVSLPKQMIHGDFTMNILFADNLPAAVIDFSPYWRPAEFAIAIIIVVDALVWEGADASILDYADDIVEINQMLARAEIRRIMEIDGHYRQYGKNGLKAIEAHRKVVELICARAR
jgi:uncharacterized protein (TIGR02569 family)